jgi:hypothetical protein
MCLLQAQGAPSLFSVIDAGHLQLGSSSRYPKNIIKSLGDSYHVGGFKHFLFSMIYGIFLPIDFHIFQDG